MTNKEDIAAFADYIDDATPAPAEEAPVEEAPAPTPTAIVDYPNHIVLDMPALSPTM